MDGGLLPEPKTENIKNPSCMNISVHTGGISSCVIIVGFLMTVSKQYQICFEMPLLPVFTGKNGGCSLFPFFFVVLLCLIYTLNIILNSNFEPTFPPIISFIKNFVAEKVAKSLVE